MSKFLHVAGKKNGCGAYKPCPFAIYIVSKWSVVRIDRFSAKVVRLIVTTVIPTNAEELVAIHIASVADTVNAFDSIG